jgi:hypothetical protein
LCAISLIIIWLRLLHRWEGIVEPTRVIEVQIEAAWCLRDGVRCWWRQSAQRNRREQFFSARHERNINLVLWAWSEWDILDSSVRVWCCL